MRRNSSRYCWLKVLRARAMRTDVWQIWSWFWTPLIVAGLQAAWLLVLQALGRAELLQFLVGCILARVAKRRTKHPTYWSSSLHPTLRENSAPFGCTLNLPLPSPLMAAWRDEYSTGFFLYNADWDEFKIRNLAKTCTRIIHALSTTSDIHWIYWRRNDMTTLRFVLW